MPSGLGRRARASIVVEGVRSRSWKLGDAVEVGGAGGCRAELASDRKEMSGGFVAVTAATLDMEMGVDFAVAVVGSEDFGTAAVASTKAVNARWEEMARVEDHTANRMVECCTSAAVEPIRSPVACTASAVRGALSEHSQPCAGLSNTGR